MTLSRGFICRLASESSRLMEDFSSQSPSPREDCQHHRNEQTHQPDEVANRNPCWFGDNRDVIEGTHQNVERHLGVEGIRIFENAYARDEHRRAHRNLLQRGKWCRCQADLRRMAHDGREDVVSRHDHVLVLPRLAHRGHDLAFNRNQVEDVMAEGKIVPGYRLRLYRCPRMRGLKLATGQFQKTVMNVREAGGIRNVVHLKVIPHPSANPQAEGTVLQHYS